MRSIERYINKLLGVHKATEELRANPARQVTTETGRSRVPIRWVRAGSALATEEKRVASLIIQFEEWCVIVILGIVEDTAMKVSSDILIFAWHDLTMDFFGEGSWFSLLHALFCTFRY